MFNHKKFAQCLLHNVLSRWHQKIGLPYYASGENMTIAAQTGITDLSKLSTDEMIALLDRYYESFIEYCAANPTVSKNYYTMSFEPTVYMLVELQWAKDEKILK